MPLVSGATLRAARSGDAPELLRLVRELATDEREPDSVVCVLRGYPRLEWWVQDWNRPAIDFYETRGAQGLVD